MVAHVTVSNGRIFSRASKCIPNCEWCVCVCVDVYVGRAEGYNAITFQLPVYNSSIGKNVCRGSWVGCCTLTPIYISFLPHPLLLLLPLIITYCPPRLGGSFVHVTVGQNCIIVADAVKNLCLWLLSNLSMLYTTAPRYISPSLLLPPFSLLWARPQSSGEAKLRQLPSSFCHLPSPDLPRVTQPPPSRSSVPLFLVFIKDTPLSPSL